MFEAHNVFVPTPANAPWIHDWREEMATFPVGANDDDVDSTTQALLRLKTEPAGLPENIRTESVSASRRYSRRDGL
jgi:phage terminase large subunit-like protein